MPVSLGRAIGFLHSVTVPSLIDVCNVSLDVLVPTACLEPLEQQRCTYVLGATSFVYDMSCNIERRPYDLSSLCFFLCGGTAIPQGVARDCQQLGIKLLSIYDLTGSPSHALVSLNDSFFHMMNTDGYAVVGVEIEVVDEIRNTLPVGVEGEEASCGPNMSMGYLDGPKFIARVLDQDGWYCSDDLCRMDDARYTKITERKKDIIIRDGENISNRETGDILLWHPRIHDACIVVMPDEWLSERSCTYVVLRPSHRSLPLGSMAVFLSHKRVAKHRYPEYIVIVEKLPCMASDEVQRYQLRQDIIQRLSVESIIG